MVYCLKHFDETLLEFDVTTKYSDRYEITWVNEAHKELLPLDMPQRTAPTAGGLVKWLRRRTIPKNRAYVFNLLSKCGLSINRTIDIISVSKGLSLNDCYWITERGFDGRFADYNLYDNKFSKVLAMIAFTGYGRTLRSSVMSSPEFTTNGMLPKCWRRINGTVSLWKGGTFGASNTGNEPYSEYYAYQIAKKLNINAVPYELHKWKGVLCSSCNLFTSKERSFVSVNKLIDADGIEAAIEYYNALGAEFSKAISDMLILDYLICNTDRHFGNFGVIIDSHTNKIISPAPLFDHGNSLLNFAGAEALSGSSALLEYANTLTPATYVSFYENAKLVLNHDYRVALRSLLDFRFAKHPRYNLPPTRLKYLEKVVQARAQKLLDS